MTQTIPAAEGRTDTALRLIRATPDRIFATFLDPAVLIRWLPPGGMAGRVIAFEPRPGGAIRIELTYLDPVQGSAAKSTPDTDLVGGRFVEIVPGRRIVQTFAFATDRAEFAGTLRMTWTFDPVEDGTEVGIRCENVPPGIRREDHLAAFRSTLQNLAAVVE